MKNLISYQLFELVSYEFYIEDQWIPNNDTKPHSIDYKFSDGVNNFIVQFTLDSHDCYFRNYFILNNDNPYAIVNNNPFRIMGTVTSITIDFIKKYNPDEIKIYHIKEVGENKRDHSLRGLSNKRSLEKEIKINCPNYSYELKKIFNKQTNKSKGEMESVSIITKTY